VKLLRYAVAHLRDVLGLRGNDGLTRRERAHYAAEYRRKAMGPLSEAEKAALVAWRERRL
jgi:hypothetical protein